MWQLIKELPSLLYALWFNLLVLLGLRKKRMPWGRVMNSVTNQPIPRAMVTLHNQDKYGRVVARELTDKNGRFGFLIEPGNYSLWAQKPGYVFPAHLLLDTYRGATFEIGPQGMIVLDLFCDPTSVYSGWRMSVTQVSYWVDLLRLPLLVIGSIASLFFFIRYASIINGAILLIYGIAWTRELYSRRYNRHTLQVVDASGKPAAFATIRVIDRQTKTAIMTRTTDAQGEIYILVPKGDYTFSITNPASQQVTNLDIPLPEGIFVKHRQVKIT